MANLSETILWIAIPNGAVTDENGKPALRLSVFVSPRLRGAQKLGDFQDFLDWPSRVETGQAKFEVEIDSGEMVSTRITSPLPDLALWQALFDEQTPINDPNFDDYSGRPIVSFPVEQVLSYLKSAYRQIAANSPDNLPSIARKPGAAEMQIALDKVFAELIDLQTHLAGQPDEPDFLSNAMKYSLEQARETARNQHAAGQFGGALIQPSGFDGMPVQQSFYRSMLFHYRLADTKPVDLPASDAETRQQYTEQIDFHQMLASLNDYPDLMRILGLVIDLQVDPADLPQADDLQKHALRIRPTWLPAAIPPDDRIPWTAYWHAPLNGVELFRPASSTGEILAGMWTPKAGDLSLVQVDVDGAALKTLNMANTLTGKAHPENQPYDAPEQDGVSTLRSKGVSLVLTDRANKINDRFNRSLDLNNLAENGQKIELYAEDLLRGYRLDVNEDGNWFSLHQRRGIYHPLNQAGQEMIIPDEGFAQPSITETPRAKDAPSDPGAEIFVHESLFTWDGWSLSAPRPGKSLSRSARAPTDADPETQPQNVPNTAGTALPLELTFQVQNGTLPRLRVGRKYQFRMRTVDLAGNSLQLDEATQLMQAFGGQMKATFPEGDALKYARYEPVSAPELAPRLAYTAGESLERLVIRSNFDQTAEEYAAVNPDWPSTNERHVVPPKAAQALVETLGLLDGAFDAQRQGFPPEQVQALIQETYALSAREKGSLNDPGPEVQLVRTGGTDAAPQVYAVHGEEQLILPYLPDPWATGVVFLGLPGVPAGQTFVIKWDGPSWHELVPFKLRLVEGMDAPEWDPENHVLTVKLGKAQTAHVRLSSLFGGDLDAMGLWQWLEEADPKVPLSPERLKELGRMVVEGKHWMFTPFRNLTLVHGVQQPLAEPRPGDFQTSRSARGQTVLHIRTQVKLDTQSTAKLDLLAGWQETRDDLSQPGPETVPVQAHVLELPVSFDGLPGRLNDPTLKDVYQLTDEGFVLQFDTDFQHSDLVPLLKKSLSDPNLTLDERRRVQDLLNLLARLTPHEFGDTKYRQVTYDFSATARFGEYFLSAGGAAALNGTRTSQQTQVEVLSSGKPDTPRLLYVLPTYGWIQSSATDGTITSTRRGGGLRVYLDRPWFSSGEGELLGIVVSGGIPSRWQNLNQQFKPDTIYPYDTYWGDDPLWTVEKIALPRPENFPGASAVGNGLRLSERPGDLVSVYGYAVEFDTERKLWYCDLDLNTGGYYYPFIRLALVRYQPNSLVDGNEQNLGSLHMSRVVTTEIVQSAPDRTLTVTRAPGDASRVILALTGPAPAGRRDMSNPLTPAVPGPVLPGTNRVEASLEVRLPDVPDETLGWQALPGSDPVGLESSAQNGGVMLWSGKVEIPAEADGQTLRLVVRESEPHTSFTPGPDGKRLLSWRLVYMDWLGL